MNRTAIIDTILGMVGLERKGVALAPMVDSSTPFAIFAGGSGKLSAERALQLNTGWVYAGVHAIAEEVAKIEFHLYKVGKENDTEVFESDLLDLLQGVNPYHTRYELLYNTAAHLELTGNAYWLLLNKRGEPVASDTEAPAQIFYLSPRYVKTLKAPLPEFIKGYRYSIDGKETDYKPYQILHFKYPDPNDPYDGIGPVQAILAWIEAENAASDFNAAFFKNGTKLAGALKPQREMSIDQQKVLRQSFEDMYRGVQKAYKIAVLPHQVEYEEMGTSPKDMDFANLQDKMRDKILGGLRVSKTVLGIAESETNRATAETADYVFSERTCKPKMTMIVQQLNEFLVPRFGDQLYLGFKSPTPEDREAARADLQAALPGVPAMTVNEARERYLDLPPLDGADELLAPFSMLPSGITVPRDPNAPSKGQKETMAHARRTVGGRRVNGKTQTARNAGSRKELSTAIAEAVLATAQKSGEQIAELQRRAKEAPATITEMTDDQYENVYTAFFTRVTPYERTTGKAVRDFNAKQKAAVLKRLPEVWPNTKDIGPAVTKAQEDAIATDLLGTGDDWLQLLVQLSQPSLQDLYEKEGKEAAKLVGTEFAMTPQVQEALKRALQLMSDSYNTTTLDLLARTIGEGLKEGVGLDEMTQRVGTIYEFSDTRRAEQVARTETFRIANDATKAAWKQSNVVESIKWYTAADERVCPFCGPLHGKVVSIDGNFFEKGQVVTGSDGQTMQLDYSSVGAPPLHVMCRCYTRPEKVTLPPQQ